jgi:integrase/recombinase XerD
MKGEGQEALNPMPRESRELILLIDDRAIAASPALVRAGLETLPSAIGAAGARTSERFIDFFTANIRNRNTRMAYAIAVRYFFDWCEQRALQLEAIRPTTVAAYIEQQLGGDMAKPSVKQHLAAIRQLFDYLVTGGILLSNPAGAVRGPKYVVKRGKTPVLSADQARQLLDSIDVAELSGLRDRALIGVMVFTFARVTAVTTMRIEDYFEHGKRAWLRLHEKGGKRHEVPCHHNLTEYLDVWILAAKIADDKKGPLFRAIRKGNKLTENPMAREDVLAMIKRRAAGAALPYSTC